MYVGTSVFIEHFFLVQTLIQCKEARSLRILASVFFEAWFSCVHFVMFAGYLCNDDSENNHLYFFFFSLLEGWSVYFVPMRKGMKLEFNCCSTTHKIL